MGRALTATGLLAVAAALVVSGCGGSDGSTTTSPKTATGSGSDSSIQINGDDPAFRALCNANSAAARHAQLHAVVQEILASPNAPAHVNVPKVTHVLKGLCGQGVSASGG